MRRLVIGLTLIFCCRCLAVSAQDSLYMNRNDDVIVYTYEPAAAAQEYSTEEQRNFIQRVFDYFDRSTVDKTFEKKMDFTFIAGPSYSSKTSLSLGVLAAGMYRTDRTDLEASPSNISLFGNVSINGYYYVGISGNTFFKRNRHRLDYELGFRSQPTDFWGLGYHDAKYNKAVNYTAKKYIVDAKYMYAIVKNIYTGATLSFNYTRAKGLNDTGRAYIGDYKEKYMVTGLGTFIEYDSRDIVTQPFSGWYISLHGIVYPKGLGDCGHTLWREKVTIDYFQKVWKGGVLAFDIYGEFNSARTPWTMYAAMGGNLRMRGYYEGRFNDRNMVVAQVELRQRIWRRIGGTVWGGAGNIFHSFDKFKWSETLPTYGIGFRWELKQRMNVRFDYGFGCKDGHGKLINGFIMSINEAF